MKGKTKIKLLTVLVVLCLLFSNLTVFAEPPSQLGTATDDAVPIPDNETYYEYGSTSDLLSGSSANTRSSSYEFFGTNIIPDGVYALQNLGNTARWVDIQYDSTTAGARVQQYAYGSTPAEGSSNSGLYKITRRASTGTYIIRLMLNQNLSFGVSGSDVYTKTIPSSDSSVSNADTFYIEYSSGGYTIRPYNSSTYISAKKYDGFWNGWRTRLISYNENA